MALSGQTAKAYCGNSHYWIYATWSATQSISGNYSTVTANLYFGSDPSWNISGSAHTFNINIDGSTYTSTHSPTEGGGTTILLGSYTHQVNHNSDGTRSFNLVASYDLSSITINENLGYPQCSGSFTLDTIPRASTVSSSVSWTAGTQNLAVSLSVADSSFHHTLTLQVQHPSGAWNTVATRTNIGSSTTMTFSQSEITSMYNQINMYENRPASLGVDTYDSSGNHIGSIQWKDGTVYAIATATITVNSSNSWNIGDNPSYSLNNYTTGSSGGFTYDFTLTLGNWSKTWSSQTAQSGTLSFTTTDVNNMYAQTPTANSISGTIRVRTYYNGVLTEDGIPTSDSTSVTCNVNVTSSVPSFSTGYTYQDTNTTVVGVTGNNQYIVQSQSTLQVALPVSALATPQNAATMSYYTASIANAIGTINYPATTPTLGTATTGGSLGAATYYVKYTWVTAAGESTPSPEASVVVPTGTSTNTVTVTLPSFPSGVTKANIYISTGTGTETLQGNATSTAYTQSAALVSGAALPSNMYFNLGTVNASADTNLQVKAVDSRGNSTTTSIVVHVVPYTLPQVTATATRLNGFEASTTLSLSGGCAAVSVGGTNKNSIKTAQYQYAQSGAAYNSFSNFTITGFPNYSATNVTLTLDNTVAWNINFVVTDQFGNTAIVKSITAGVPIMAIDSALNSVGVGQFPKNANTLEVSGDLWISGMPRIQTLTATTPATVGWYRIAQSASGIGYCLGDFEIKADSSTYKSLTKIHANIANGSSYNDIRQISHAYAGSGTALTQARMVYDTTATGNYAYLEVYLSQSVAATITVRLSNAYGWSLITPNTAGSIPSGYTSSTATLYAGFTGLSLNGIAVQGGAAIEFMNTSGIMMDQYGNIKVRDSSTYAAGGSWGVIDQGNTTKILVPMGSTGGAVSIPSFKSNSIQAGAVSVTATGGTVVTATVTFPTAFATAPFVTADVSNSTSPQYFGQVVLGTGGKTSFTISCNPSVSASPLWFNWIAVSPVG